MHKRLRPPIRPMSATNSSGVTRLSWICERVERIAHADGPLDVKLSRIGEFPAGIIHLLPEPGFRLRELTSGGCRLPPVPALQREVRRRHPALHA
jgi:hypothetical protein